MLRLEQARRLVVGSRGPCRFPNGWYLYCGSARGPGGLAARLRHHARIARRPHWHLDYLRPHCQVHAFWVCRDLRVTEHDLAGQLLRMPGAAIVLAGFGASDCRCTSHLVRFPICPSAPHLADRLVASLTVIG